MHIHRPIIAENIPSLKQVLDSCGLFPSDYLEEMISPYLSGPDSDDLWYTTALNKETVSIGFVAPEKLTNGTYNLYAIGVHKAHQGKGIGRSLLEFIENELRTKDARILIIETSSSPDQKIARDLYLSAGYTKEATLRDFWDEGEDKVIFWKHLNK